MCRRSGHKVKGWVYCASVRGTRAMLTCCAHALLSSIPYTSLTHSAGASVNWCASRTSSAGAVYGSEHLYYHYFPRPEAAEQSASSSGVAGAMQRWGSNAARESEGGGGREKGRGGRGWAGLGLDRAGLPPQVAGASVGCRRGAVEGLMWIARVAKIRMA